MKYVLFGPNEKPIYFESMKDLINYEISISCYKNLSSNGSVKE